MRSASSTEYWLAGKLMYSAAGASRHSYLKRPLKASTSEQGEESWGRRLPVPRGRASCWTETDSERRATNRALGADEDDDDGEEEARERRKAAGTGGSERRNAAIGARCVTVACVAPVGRP